MRCDSGEGYQGWNGTVCSAPEQCGPIGGGSGKTPKGASMSSYVIGLSTDRGRSWRLKLAPSFMRSCRPRAITLEGHIDLCLSPGYASTTDY